MEPEDHWVVEENHLPFRSMPSGSMWVSSRVHQIRMTTVDTWSVLSRALKRILAAFPHEPWPPWPAGHHSQRAVGCVHLAQAAKEITRSGGNS